MHHEESTIGDIDLGSDNLQQLDQILMQVIDTLEKGRGDIFDIAEESRQHCARLKVELEELRLETKRIIDKVQKCEKMERYARLHLMEVSRNFRSYAENDIKQAYDSARELQLRLVDLRQGEMYARRNRDEISRHIKHFEAINQKADGFLNSTSFALKVLKGNVEKITETIEDSVRKQQIGIWIIESQETERRKLARDLHDGPAQNLASMMIRLDLVQHLWEGNAERIYAEIENIKEMGAETLSEIRRLMFDLKPTLVHEDNFCATLASFVRDYSAKYDLDIEFIAFGKRKKYDLSLEIALFRMVQEAITNIRKHAGINQALLKLEDNDQLLRLVIRDDGCGFDVDRAARQADSYGIMGMKERVALLGGEVQIKSSPGRGTQVIITVPLEGDANDGQN